VQRLKRRLSTCVSHAVEQLRLQHVLVMLRQFAVERDLALQEELLEVERRRRAANVAERAVRPALVRVVTLLEIAHHHDVHTYTQNNNNNNDNAAGERQLPKTHHSVTPLSIAHHKEKKLIPAKPRLILQHSISTLTASARSR
jgi:hypothetical protein